MKSKQVAEPVQIAYGPSPIEEKLRRRIDEDLSFRGVQTAYASHNTHAFAAKFPPQLPRTFIAELSEPGEVVLDPMVGSGTALVEAALAGRKGIGVDLDPLAVKICRAKTYRINADEATLLAEEIADRARLEVATSIKGKSEAILDAFPQKTREFVRYWFFPDTITELASLAASINLLCPPILRTFFEVVLSSVIITKSGGVSRARDLAHTRPHRVTDKRIKNAVDAFEERAVKAIAAVSELRSASGSAHAFQADSRALPLPSSSIDLVVTSPPYANAIDYVRAHKFSLIWLGYDIEWLGRFRRQYIGAEVKWRDANSLPSSTALDTIRSVARLDQARAGIIARYFHEMKATIQEMHRVLKPGRAAVIVVGSSTVRGVVVPTALSLAEIGEAIGFKLIGVKVREIDRDRRLMPISRDSSESGIEARMHREEVLALVKQ